MHSPLLQLPAGKAAGARIRRAGRAPSPCLFSHATPPNGQWQRCPGHGGTDSVGLISLLTLPRSHLIQPADIERETGLDKDLLRKWRVRYGFPIPTRTTGAPAAYSREQVAQLRLIRRLIDAGMRPVQVVGKSIAELTRLDAALANRSDKDAGWGPTTRRAIQLLEQHDLIGVRALLAHERSRTTLANFVRETIVPLVTSTGEAWVAGQLSVYQEHLCTSLVRRHLLHEIAGNTATPGYPRILFGTLPEELHELGLLMAEAVLGSCGADCISVGAQIPLLEMDRTARACRADIVALSFSAAYPIRRIQPALQHLRQLLPDEVEIWAGGAGCTSAIKRPPPGVRTFSDLIAPVQALHERVGSKKASP
jgi:MerR family transcriptional regulator, light-induced transcriptional regulator